MASQTKRYKEGNLANHAMTKSCLNMPWLSSGLLALQHSKKLECDIKSITIYESFINSTSMVQADKSPLLLYSGNNSPQLG